MRASIVILLFVLASVQVCSFWPIYLKHFVSKCTEYSQHPQQIYLRCFWSRPQRHTDGRSRESLIIVKSDIGSATVWMTVTTSLFSTKQTAKLPVVYGSLDFFCLLGTGGFSARKVTWWARLPSAVQFRRRKVGLYNDILLNILYAAWNWNNFDVKAIFWPIKYFPNNSGILSNWFSRFFGGQT